MDADECISRLSLRLYASGQDMTLNSSRKPSASSCYIGSYASEDFLATLHGFAWLCACLRKIGNVSDSKPSQTSYLSKNPPKNWHWYALMLMLMLGTSLSHSPLPLKLLAVTSTLLYCKLKRRGHSTATTHWEDTHSTATALPRLSCGWMVWSKPPAWTAAATGWASVQHLRRDESRHKNWVFVWCSCWKAFQNNQGTS